MKNLKISIALIAISIFTFYAFVPVEPVDKSLETYWIYDGYEDGVSVYKKSKRFEQDKPGFEFQKDGIMIKRQNVGWCGTPPISYGNYKGKWKQIEDNKLQLEYDYWGGRDTMILEIVSLTKEDLKVRNVTAYK